MGKMVKRVYLPAGLLVSMYNLYSDGHKEGDVISMYDVELMCSFLEFYFNYTEVDKKDYIYRFYTLPYFYTSKSNEAKDAELFKRDRALMDKYATKVGNVQGENQLNNLASNIWARKLTKLRNYSINKGKELDSTFDESRGLPNNSYEMGLMMNANNFRLNELYKKGVFSQGKDVDFSTFFLLKADDSSIGKLNQEANENEMHEFLDDYFSSDVYKILEVMDGRGSDKFAPKTEIFIDCFKKATEAFSVLNFEGENNLYAPTIGEAQIDYVPIEII